MHARAHTHTHTHTHIMYLLFDCCLLKYYCISARQQKVFWTVLMKIKWQQNWVAGERWRKDIGGRMEGNYEQRSPGESKGYPLQYSCLENSMDRGAYWAIVHGVTKSWTQLSDWHRYTHEQMSLDYRKNEIVCNWVTTVNISNRSNKRRWAKW